MTNKAGSKEEMEDNDGYYDNDDVFPAEYKTSDQENKTIVMKASKGKFNNPVATEESSTA